MQEVLWRLVVFLLEPMILLLASSFFIILVSISTYKQLKKRTAVHLGAWAVITSIIVFAVSIVILISISGIINRLQPASSVSVSPIEQLEAGHIERIEYAIAQLEFSELITHFRVQEFERDHAVLQRRYTFGFHYFEDFARRQPHDRSLSISVTVFATEEIAIGRMQSERIQNSSFDIRYTEFMYYNGAEVILNQPYMSVGSLRLPHNRRLVESHIRFGDTVFYLRETRLRHDNREDISSKFIQLLVETMLKQYNY